MDLDLPDKSLEQSYGEAGTLFAGELDLNLHENKVHLGLRTTPHETETPNEGMPVNSAPELQNTQVEPVDFVNTGSQYPVTKTNSASPTLSSKQADEPLCPVELDLQNDGAESKIPDEIAEGPGITNSNYDSVEEKVDHAAWSTELLESDADKISKYEEPKHSDTVFVECKFSPEDNDRFHELNNTTYDDGSARSTSLAVTEDEGFRKMSEISQHESVYSDNDKMQGESVGCDKKMKEDNYPSEIVPSSQEMIRVESSSPYSDPQAPNRMPSPEQQISSPVRRSTMYHNETPSLERQPTIPAEGSPDNQPSAKQAASSPPNKEKHHSRSPSMRKRYRSPGSRTAARKRVPSPDQMSPHAKRRSPSGRAAPREPRHGDDSPRSQSGSPRKRESPLRRGKSASRSPVRRRDTSRHQRDHNGRSRSRSPYARDHSRRSPRRRHSPRHRSPSSHYSRRHSPRRPWSPPANRKTGIGRPGKNLFVAGFSYATTERDLERKFSRYGRVTDVRVVRDRRSGDSRGFGFVSLERDEDADAAIRALDKTEWNGRIILVEKSKAPAR